MSREELTALTDAELVDRMKRKEADAELCAECLVARHREHLRRIVRRQVPDERAVDQILWTAIHAALHRIERLRDSTRFWAWLRRIAQNHVLSYIRNEKQDRRLRVDVVDLDLLPGDRSPGCGFWQQVLESEAMAEVMKLPGLWQTIVLKKVVDRWDYGRIGVLVGTGDKNFIHVPAILAEIIVDGHFVPPRFSSMTEMRVAFYSQSSIILPFQRCKDENPHNGYEWLVKTAVTK